MRTQFGFSILEVLIAIVISMIMLAGVLQIFLNSKNVYNIESNFANLQENGRFATTYLARIVRLSGYRTPPTTPQIFQDYTTVFPVATPYVTGTSGTGPNGSDTITVRYQGSGNGTGTPDGTIRDCLNNGIDSNTLASSTFSITNNNELQCQAINPNASPTNNTQILVSGVENMKVLYGEDVDGNGTADRYVAANFPSLNMARVVSVRISLLLRSNDPVDLIQNSVTYYILGQSYTPTATNYLRQQATFTVVLRNLLSQPQ